MRKQCKQEVERRDHKYELRGQERKQRGQKREENESLIEQRVQERKQRQQRSEQRGQDRDQCGQKKEENGSVIEQHGIERKRRIQKREQRGQDREQCGQKKKERGCAIEQRGKERKQRGRKRDQRGQKIQLPYAERLLTFDNWPVDPRVAPEDWAGAGFTWTGREDVVNCAVCNFNLRGIKVGIDPWQNHAMRYPPCEFLKKKMGTAFVMKHQVKSMREDGQPYQINELKRYCKIAGVQHEYKELAPYCVTHKDRTAILLVPLIEAGLDGDPDIKKCKAIKAKLKREEEEGDESEEGLESFDERFETFANWREDDPLLGDSLADAGFRFDSQNNQVYCEECDLVYEWKEGDNPWDRHASKYPPCYFIKKKRGGMLLIKENQIKGTSADGQPLYINTLREYCKVAGLRYNYRELVKDCVTHKDRTDKLLALLHAHGLEGEPTMEKCKVLNAKWNYEESDKVEKEKQRQKRKQRNQGREQRWQERQKRKREGDQCEREREQSRHEKERRGRKSQANRGGIVKAKRRCPRPKPAITAYKKMTSSSSRTNTRA